MSDPVGVKVGQEWMIDVHHLGGRLVRHRVTALRDTWVDVEVLEHQADGQTVNGYCAVPRERFERLRQAPTRGTVR